MKVSFVRPTVSCMFYRCPVCNGESTIIGTTFYCVHCGCEIDDVFDDLFSEPYIEEKEKD